ncbi:MAG: hypothetical protein ACREEN_00505 [Stellaceae bacterium]
MTFRTIETVVAPAQPGSGTPTPGAYDLTTLAVVKSELTMTDTENDTILQQYITQESDVISRYCNRVFQVEGVQNTVWIERDPTNFMAHGPLWSLQLSRWPIPFTTSTTFTGNTHGTNVVDGISAGAIAQLKAGMMVFAGDLPTGAMVQAVNIGSGSITLSTAVSDMMTGVSFTTGISVVVTGGDDAPLTLVQGTDFMVNPTTGALLRLSSTTGQVIQWPFLPLTTIFPAGYAALPGAVQDAAIRLVTARWKQRGRDPTVKQENQPGLGGPQYWVGTIPGSRGSMPPEIADKLDNFRVPMAA